MKQTMEKVTKVCRCTSCYAPLTESDGNLTCVGSPSHKYSIKNGIPSFAEIDDFEEHWADHGAETIPPTKIDRATRFLRPVFAGIDDNMLLLDVGCGDGAHAMTIRSRCAESVSYFGVDISVAALLSTKKNVENAYLLRGSALNLPFQDNSIDVAFSYGVLGYTGAPDCGIREMARVVKQNGLIGIWIAQKETGLLGAILATVRKICNLGGRPVTNLIANSIVPFLSFLPVASGVNLGNASWKQCKEIVLVNIQPENLIYPTREEVLSWMQAADLTIVEEDEENPITLWARPM